DAIKFGDPSVPVVCNVDAAIVQNATASKDALIRQVTGAVRWVDCMKLMIAKNVSAYVEVGPGKVLCGLMRQIDRSKSCVNVGDESSLQKALEQLTEKG